MLLNGESFFFQEGIVLNEYMLFRYRVIMRCSVETLCFTLILIGPWLVVATIVALAGYLLCTLQMISAGYETKPSPVRFAC